MDVSPPQRLTLRALSHLFLRAWVRTLLFAIISILILLNFRFSRKLAQKPQLLALNATLYAPEAPASGRTFKQKAPEGHTSRHLQARSPRNSRILGTSSARVPQKCLLLGMVSKRSPRSFGFWENSI